MMKPDTCPSCKDPAPWHKDGCPVITMAQRIEFGGPPEPKTDWGVVMDFVLVASMSAMMWALIAYIIMLWVKGPQ